VNAAEFVAEVGPYADQVASATGLNRWAVITQWALETGWGSPNSTFGWNNLAGIIFHGEYSDANGFTQYPSLEAFTQDYIAVLRQPNMAVILASAGKSIGEQLVAFGQSPWAGSHYNNGRGPGSSLVSLYDSTIAPLAGGGSSQPAQPAVPSQSSESGGLSDVDRDFLFGEIVKVAHATGVTLDTPPWADSTRRTYTVKPGDSLSAIAAQYLGDGNKWPQLYDLNKSVIGPNPDLIHPGQVLVLPD